MRETKPLACPLMQTTCVDGVTTIRGRSYTCSFSLDGECLIFDALQNISVASDSFNQVTDNGVQMSVAVAGAVDTYEQN